MSSSKKSNIGTLGAVAVMLLAVFVCWASFCPRALEGAKEISVYITHSDGYIRAETYETTARDLAEALEPLDLFGDTYDAEGWYAGAVDGEAPGENAAWAYSVNDAKSELPPDEQPVADGDKFSFYILRWNEDEPGAEE